MAEVDIDGIRLAFDDVGEGEPILLIPGLGEPRSTWSVTLQPQLAAAGWRTVAFDVRGMPPSSAPPAPYAIDDLVADTAGLIEALSLAPCRIVGYSLGGWIAERLAATRPELVSAVALVASANDGCAWEKLRYQLGVDLARLPHELPPLYEIVSLLSYLPTTALQDDATVESWAALLAEGIEFPNPGRLGQWQAAVDWVARTDRDDDRAAIRCPTLVMGFEFDWDCPPALARAAAERIPGATYVELAGCGHLAVFEQPAAVGAAILEFFRPTRP